MNTMQFKDLLYTATCLSFAIVIGAAVYEHLAVVPRWTQALPASLSMFQGKYGLDAQAFWIPIHPITLALFAISAIVCWKLERRANLLIAGVGYMIVLAATFVFFVPELIELTETGFSANADTDLTRRAQLWQTLSLLRLAFMLVLSLILFLGLTKHRKRADLI